MAIQARVTGVRELKYKLGLSKQMINQATKQGIGVAGLMVQRDSQEMTPVETGNLKASAFTRTKQKSANVIEGTVGYTAAYALPVHEALMKLKGQPRRSGRGLYWDPQGKATNKFLEKSFRKNIDNIEQTIDNSIKAAIALL